MPRFKHTNKNSKVVFLRKNTSVFCIQDQNVKCKGNCACMLHFGSIIRQITERCKNKTLATVVPLRLILDFLYQHTAI